MKKFLLISNSNELVRVAPEHIVCITADGDYSTLLQADGESRVVLCQLGKLVEMINSQLGVRGNDFIRLGRSLIINLNYVHYINVPKQKLVLSDSCSVNHTVTASKEALKQLKEFIEREGK